MVGVEAGEHDEDAPGHDALLLVGVRLEARRRTEGSDPVPQVAPVVQRETVHDPGQRFADGPHPSDQRRVASEHLHLDAVVERAVALDDPPEDVADDVRLRLVLGLGRREVVGALEEPLVLALAHLVVLYPVARQTEHLVGNLAAMEGPERFAQVAEDVLGLLEGVEAVRHDGDPALLVRREDALEALAHERADSDLVLHVEAGDGVV